MSADTIARLKITLDDVKKAAQKYLSKDKFVVSVVKPK